MRKNKKNIYHLKKGSLLSAIIFFKEKYKNFTLTKTGHTYKFEAGNEVFFFSDSKTSPNCFISSRMIEKDLADSLELIQEIKPENINYYDFPEFTNKENISCVDISAAYPNALKNLGYISEKTFKSLMRLKKSDRLKSVGMLATKKAVYTIQEKKLIKAETIRKNTEKVFFNLCDEIGKIMTEIVKLYGNKIIFFWVDGIFCESSIANEILIHINKKGYPAKIEEVRNLKKSKNNSFIMYEKKEKDVFKPKILPIPRKKTIFEENVFRFFNPENKVEIKETLI